MNVSLFEARGVAVVGASPKSTNLGRSVLTALAQHAYSGRVAAVNPNYQDVDGTPCYADLAAVPFPVDLALLFVRAADVIDVVRQAATARLKNVIIYSSGFAELGAAGLAQQRELAELARQSGLRLLGPNCQGVVDFRTGLAATFSPSVLSANAADTARIAYVGQSGAVGGAFFDLARQRGCTPSTWVSTGNEVDLGAVEIGRELAESADFDLICMYLEQTPQGRQWLELTDAAAKTNTRLAVLRSGRSAAGKRAAASHTGALVADDAAFEIVCATTGVLEAEDLDELVDLAISVRCSRTPRGRGVAVVTTSGGAGGLAADHLDAVGLPVSTLSDETTQRLRAALPDFAGVTNPVDVTAEFMTKSAERLDEVCGILADDESVDQILLVLTNVVGEMAMAMARKMQSRPGVPTSVVYLAAPDRIEEPVAVLRAAGIPVFQSIHAAARSLAHSCRPQRSVVRPVDVASALPPPDTSSSTQWGSRALLAWAGVPMSPAELISGPREAVDAVKRLGGSTYAVKVLAPELLHKSEHGLVKVGVLASAVPDTVDELLRTAADVLPNVRVEGALVELMAGPGTELIVGVAAGARGYPATVTVGIGGKTVEVYKDVVTAFAPIDESAARELMMSLRGASLLTGFRGSPPGDIESAARAIAAISRLAVVPDLIEAEVNPLIVHQDGAGATAVDLVVQRARPDAATACDEQGEAS